MTASLAVAQLLADAPTGKAGPIGLFVIVVLCVACWFLFRSMSRHLKRVPESFDEDPGGNTTAGDVPPPGAPGTSAT